MTASTYSGPTALCAHSMDLMATGSREDFERVLPPAGGQPRGSRRAAGRPRARAGRVLRHRPVAARRVLRPAL